MSRRVLLAITVAALAAAVLLAVSGGLRITVGGLRISATSPVTALVVGLVAGSAWIWLALRSRGVEQDLIDASSSVERSAPAMVAVIAALSAGIAIVFGTFSPAGADASGYLSQAAMWAEGRWRIADPLALMSGWPADPGITAPLGWNASLDRGWQVPTYGPGLPLLMAVPFTVAGTIGASLIVAASSAITVLAVSSIASHLAGPAAALIAAFSVATAPVFLYQSLQPMSDVPVTAAWIVCWWFLIKPAFGSDDFSELRRGPIMAAGVAGAIAVLIRPNLAPLAIVPLVFVAHAADRGRRLTHIAAFSVPVALAGGILGWLQWQWYGSPLQSGYGSVQQLYSFAYIGPNVIRYSTWLASTSPVLLLALLTSDAFKRTRLMAALATFAVLNVAAYLVYFVFEEWSYLRFLLPGLAIAAVFTGLAIAMLLRRLPMTLRGVVLVAAVLAVCGLGIWRARSLDVFRLAEAHRRVVQIDRYLDAALPERAVIVAGEQSGAVRFDTGHDIVRWEAASRDDLSRALSVLDRDRRTVWVLLDVWEEPLFRAKFEGLDAVSLDWPPAVDAGDAHRTRAWRLEDRARYLQGDRLVTDRLR